MIQRLINQLALLARHDGPDPCWCPKSIGHPAYNIHSETCEATRITFDLARKHLEQS